MYVVDNLYILVFYCMHWISGRLHAWLTAAANVLIVNQMRLERDNLLCLILYELESNV